MIIAVWAKGLGNLYDAYDAAKMLPDWPQKYLENHLDEYLVYGGISADDHRVVTIVEGQKEQEIVLSLPGLRGSTRVPDSLMADVPAEKTDEELRHEIYRHTGVKGDSSEQFLCLAGVMTGAFGVLVHPSRSCRSAMSERYSSDSMAVNCNGDSAWDYFFTFG